MTSVKLSKKEKRLKQLFYPGPVTKLPNRYKLEQFGKLLNKNGDNSDKSLALIFIHVEGIHAVGDAFGQDIEDQLMRLLSERLYGAIGKYGLFVRRYTDQFVLFYPCDSSIKNNGNMPVGGRITQTPLLLRVPQSR